MGTGFLESLTGIWTALSDWFISSMQDVMGLFYDSTGDSLTIFGVFAIISLGIAITMLVINRVLDFIKLRS